MNIRDNFGKVKQVQNTVLVTVNISVVAMVFLIALSAFFWRDMGSNK